MAPVFTLGPQATSLKTTSPKPRFLILPPAKKTFGETFGAATGVSEPGYKEKEETMARAARQDRDRLFLLLGGEVGNEVDELLFGHGWSERGHEGGRHFIAADEVGFFQF